MDVSSTLLQMNKPSVQYWKQMVDSRRIDLEQLEQSLNLELAANEDELHALEKALDDRLINFDGRNNPRNVTPSDGDVMGCWCDVQCNYDDIIQFGRLSVYYD